MLHRMVTTFTTIFFLVACQATYKENTFDSTIKDPQNLYSQAKLTVSKGDVVDKEMESRQNIKKTVFDLFLNNEFKKLDEFAQTLVNENTSSGISSYSRFMYSVGDLVRAVLDKNDQKGLVFLNHQFGVWEKELTGSSHFKLSKLTYMISLAWHYRSSGFSDTVTDEQFELFHKQLNVAKDYAEEIKLDINNPHWYVQMLRIYKGLDINGEEYILLANTGIALYPNFYEIYFRAADYLSPKWHGNEVILEDFMRASAENISSTDGISIYSRIFWTQHHPSINLLFNRDLMRASMFEVVNEYPDEWNIQNFAKIACDIQDAQTARDLLQLMISEPKRNVWYGVKRYNSCRELANLNE